MEESKNQKYTNHLIHESSPYLLQHAHNPVDWHPWGEEAFEKARQEDKLVLVSIGYAACHWCHVMEHESFEDEEIARLMNENFICIKVDREERPDVDHQYMDAVQLLTGRGGWPLNCFALPDGRPVWGGTYFRPSQWTSVLKQLSEMYQTNRQPLLEQAAQLENGIRNNNLIETASDNNEFSRDELNQSVSQWKNRFDMKWGGNERAPKFPMPANLAYLLDYTYFTGDEAVKDFVMLSLDKMQMGGIYDHLAGGFSRYSTDEKWIVPHFEKMLYDNAQLIGLYAKAYRMWHKAEYKTVVYQTVGFLKRELLSEGGTFYASLDADSEGEEGKFYIWTKKEVDEILGEAAPLFEEVYSITKNGNWEDEKNILYLTKSVESIAEEMNIPPNQLQKELAVSSKKLLSVREQRIRPQTDTKILTSWNALTITGLTEAYRAFDDTMFLNMALKAADFIRDHRLEDSGKLYRAAKNPESMIPAFMDDYAATSQAFVNLYQVTFDAQWLQLAKKITLYSLAHYFDHSSGLFAYSSTELQLVTGKKMEMSDNVIPSSNAIMAEVLYELGIYFENKEWLDISEKMLSNAYDRILQNPGYHAQWALLLNRFVFPAHEVVFTGENALELRSKLENNYLPVLMAGSKDSENLPLLKNRLIKGKTLIYVCENQSCKLPVTTVEEALAQIGK